MVILIKKILIPIITFFSFFALGFNNSTSSNYKSDIVVKGITLKVSLIQTAYELYNVNVKNPKEFNEDLYKSTSYDAYKHYIWLKDTYNDMDDDLKNSLYDIFTTNDSWSYSNAVIGLDDNSSLEDIIKTILNDDYLNLSPSFCKEFDNFFTSFYEDYFKSYFYKNKASYEKKANDINNLLASKEVDIINFIESSSGLDIDNGYSYTFYYSLNPVESQGFKSNKKLISTIPKNTPYKDIISIPLHEFSHIIFEYFVNSDEFLDAYEKLKDDKKLTKMYDKVGKYAYNYKDFCSENLIEGFSKFLNYRYFQGVYEENIYVYDLDFYRYLRKLNFNPQASSLKDVSINFLEKTLNLYP